MAWACVLCMYVTENNTIWLNGRHGARYQSVWGRHTSEQTNLSFHFLLFQESIKHWKGLFSIREWDLMLKCTFPSVRITAAAGHFKRRSVPLPCLSTSQRRGGSSAGLPGCGDWGRKWDKALIIEPYETAAERRELPVLLLQWQRESSHLSCIRGKLFSSLPLK